MNDGSSCFGWCSLEVKEGFAHFFAGEGKDWKGDEFGADVEGFGGLEFEEIGLENRENGFEILDG